MELSGGFLEEFWLMFCGDFSSDNLLMTIDNLLMLKKF